MPKKGEKAIKDDRTTLSLSLTVEDKRLLKQAALDRNTTIAAMVHEWIQGGFAGIGSEEKRG